MLGGNPNKKITATYPKDATGYIRRNDLKNYTANTNLHKESSVCPIPEANGHNAPRLVAELVPYKATMVEDISVGFKNPVREPILAHELPDVFDRVKCR